MEYAGSYALFNYRLQDPAKGLEYDNLRLIRAFEHGLDPSSSEAGFVLVHIAMVKESGALVKGVVEALEGSIAKDRERFDDGLRTAVDGLKNVNAVMNSECIILFWIRAKPNDLQQCGIAPSPRATPTSAHSSSASHRNLCSPMASSTKVSARSQCPSEANQGPMTAW